jgi:hypothetical protein
MREIKFRAWHKDLKEMFYNCLVNGSCWWNEDTHYGGEHDTLMQYTGLKDCNGKEIYEGDICRSDDIEAPIKYLLGAFWFGAVLLLEPKEIEIIGNIYENPELLKKE